MTNIEKLRQIARGSQIKNRDGKWIVPSAAQVAQLALDTIALVKSEK